MEAPTGAWGSNPHGNSGSNPRGPHPRPKEKVMDLGVLEDVIKEHNNISDKEIAQNLRLAATAAQAEQRKGESAFEDRLPYWEDRMITLMLGVARLLERDER